MLEIGYLLLRNFPSIFSFVTCLIDFFLKHKNNYLEPLSYGPVRLLGSLRAGISALTFSDRTDSRTCNSHFRDLLSEA